MSPLNSVSVNVRGLRQQKKRLSVFEWLKKNHLGDKSFIFMQETHSTPEIETLWEDEWGCNIYFCHGSSNSRGILIIPPIGDDYKIERLYTDSLGRIMVLKVEHCGECYFLVNVYAPSDSENDKLIFGNRLSSCLDNLMSSNEQFNCILGGDLNICLQPTLDSYSQNDSNANYRNLILSMMENLNLTDARRIINPDLKRYTWRRNRPLQQFRNWLI